MSFSLKKDFISSVEKHYPNAEFYHYSTALASRLINEDNRDSSCILIHKRDEELYLLISKNNEIVLLNLFNVRSDTDIIYFVLNSMRENKISQDSGRLYYSGDINPEDNSVLTLKKYLANIRELPPRKGDVPDNSLHNYFRFKPIK